MTSRIGFSVALLLWALGSATAQTPMFRTKPFPPPPGEARQTVSPVSASQVLTGEAERAPQGPLPAGSGESPWSGGVQAGAYEMPVGGNGPLTYEILGYGAREWNCPQP